MEENNELKDFIIEDETNPNEITLNNLNLEVTASTDVMESFDFSSKENFNIEENYELISKLQSEVKDEETVKFEEATKIISESAEQCLGVELAKKYQTQYDNLVSFVKRYSTENEETQNLSDDEINQLQGIANYLYINYQKDLSMMHVNIEFTPKEFKYIHHTIWNKYEYDVNDMLTLVAPETYILPWIDKYALDFQKNKNEIDPITTTIHVRGGIYLYHYLSKNKVKGIGEEFWKLKNILLKIGEGTKLYNSYQVLVERLSRDFTNWSTALDAMIEERKAAKAENVITVDESGTSK
jgi:hypothetical protein